MDAETNRALVLMVFDRAFNHGDTSVFDEHVPASGTDHQENPGTEMRPHLKEIVTMLRTAFPDLHFEIHDALAEGEIVAVHSTMTGTHLGPFMGVPPTGRPIKVRHMHFLRWQNGQNTDLWHLWDVPGLMRQLNGPQPAVISTYDA
ncbi:ester cyclase [Deinococcus alpinitundrae]|uniref:ester cyclase n=1 Tax=Deinococcus alpinitundrae TaxID=468913 RepID=UPI00137A0970|nr:ester cyclase [Deinococcus alpinitundrae]